MSKQLAAQQAPPPSILDRFFAMAGQAAQKGNIKTLVMIGQDPVTGEIKLVASPGAMDAVRDLVAAKFGLSDPDTDVAWPSNG